MNYLDFNKSIILCDCEISSSELISAAEQTNAYIIKLIEVFRTIDFDVFNSLGQRNISGFIGEIFKSFLSTNNEFLLPNPHPDGRPDILFLNNRDIQVYYSTCFNSINDRKVPIKDKFSPFAYGGLEVKCSIGSSTKSLQNKYIQHYGRPFGLYMSRVGYIGSINWWAHHNSSSNLLGLYYDYYANLEGVPQVIAAFYSTLSEADWQRVSIGKPENKKTSNTSLNTNGLQKMKNNCIFCCTDPEYINQLKRIGVVFTD